MADQDGSDFIELTADIVSAYVSNNSVPASDLPALISDVHAVSYTHLTLPTKRIV